MQRERLKRTGQEPKFGSIKRVFDKTNFLFHFPTELSRYSFWNQGYSLFRVHDLPWLSRVGGNQRKIHSLLIRTLEYFLPFIRLVYSRSNCYGWNLHSEEQYNYQMQIRCTHSTVKYKWNLQLSWSSIAPVSQKSRVRILLKPWYFSGFFLAIYIFGVSPEMILRFHLLISFLEMCGISQILPKDKYILERWIT